MKVEKILTEVFAPWAVLVVGSTALGATVRSPGWGAVTGLGLGGFRRRQSRGAYVARRYQIIM